MIARLLNKFKTSFNLNSDGKHTRCSQNYVLGNFSKVVSTVPMDHSRSNHALKEGKLVVTERLDELLPHSFLLFEWIPIEGYYSRFSKRKVSVIADSDLLSNEESSTTSNPAELPVSFWQIFRTTSTCIQQVKLIWTDWTKDVGYFIIKDFDSLRKNFKLCGGGLRKLSLIIGERGYQKRVSTIDLYQIIYFTDVRVSKSYPLPVSPDIFGKDQKRDMYGVGVERYESFFNEHGQMEDIFNFKRMAFYCGLHPAIRKEAWKFLLGFYTYSSTPEERFALCEESKQCYWQLSQNRHKVEEKDKLHKMLRKSRAIINKDVHRTDRGNSFYAGSDNKNLKTLTYDVVLTPSSILMNYVFTRPHIGYTQGMSDLLAPLLQVLRNESDTFWCFIEFIENIYCAVFPSDDNMDHIMRTFCQLIKFLRPHLWSLMEAHDLEVCLVFTHRWYLLCFQREFPSPDVMKLWEACWSTQYCPVGYFQFYIGLAILECYHMETASKTSIFSHSMEEVLLFFTNNRKYDCLRVLRAARRLLESFRQSVIIPCELRCFLDYQVGGGWEDSFKPHIDCRCETKNGGSCINGKSMAKHMSSLKSKTSSTIDIKRVRQDSASFLSYTDDAVFEQ